MNINIVKEVNLDNINCGDLIIDRSKDVYTIMKCFGEQKYHIIRLKDNLVSGCTFNTIQDSLKYFGKNGFSIIEVIPSHKYEITRR